MEEEIITWEQWCEMAGGEEHLMEILRGIPEVGERMKQVGFDNAAKERVNQK
jgi:hypothetical protein